MQDLVVSFSTTGGSVPAVREIEVSVGERETVALVGESGSGKSTAALSILRLIPSQRADIDGAITFDSRVLNQASARQLRQIRGAEIAMVFQDPMTSLNPTVRVGTQIDAALRAHTELDRAGRRARVAELLTLVGLPDVPALMRAYPHSLSGGMLQRVVIALALSCQPRLLVADEPTTALDVTIQAQILQLLRRLQRELGLSILLITHDFGVVAEMADRVYVMHAGRIVESGSVGQVLTAPRHHYTAALLAAMPRLDRPRMRTQASSGIARAFVDGGCSYRARCPLAGPECETAPPLELTDIGRKVACWHPIQRDADAVEVAP